MAYLEKQLYIKTSAIPDSAKGLFTKKAIPKGTIIVEYKGAIKTWAELEPRSKTEYIYGYLYELNRNKFIDATRTKKALARYANDAMGARRVKGLTNNSIFVNDGKKAFIKAIKDIDDHTEILVRYGRMYWDVYKKGKANGLF